MKKAAREKAIHWASRVSQAKNWNLIIREATNSRTVHDYNKYYRAVTTLIAALFKEERTKALEHQQKIDDALNRIDEIEGDRIQYELKLIDDLFGYTIDLIEEYLKAYYVPKDEGTEEYEPGSMMDI